MCHTSGSLESTLCKRSWAALKIWNDPRSVGGKSISPFRVDVTVNRMVRFVSCSTPTCHFLFTRIMSIMSGPTTHPSGIAAHPPNLVTRQQQQQQHSLTKNSSTSSSSSSSSSHFSSFRTSHHAPSPGTTTTPYRTATYGCSAYLLSLLVFSTIILSCVIHSSFNYQLDPKGCIMTTMQPHYYKILGFDEKLSRFAGKYHLLLYRDDDYDDRFLPSLYHMGSNLVTPIRKDVWAVDKSVKV